MEVFMIDYISSEDEGSTTSTAAQVKFKPYCSNDIGWEFGKLISHSNYDNVQCDFCGLQFGGGIYCLKQHIAQINEKVEVCPNATLEAIRECKDALENINIKEQIEEQEKAHQKKIEEFQECISSWFHKSGLPLEAINNDAFYEMIEAVGQYGPGFVMPTESELRDLVSLEKREFKKEIRKKHENEWNLNGCSLIVYFCKEKNRQNVVKSFVHSNEGIHWYGSKLLYDKNNVVKYLDRYVESIGVNNVVQIVNDDLSSDLVELVLKNRPNIIWTNCANGVIKSVLTETRKFLDYNNIIGEVKNLAGYIHSNYESSSFMKKFIKKRDIKQPNLTQFAISFYSLQNLYEKKEDLKSMVISDDWNNWENSSNLEGENAKEIILNDLFWEKINKCLIVFTPLVQIIKITNSDRPSMPWIYGEFLKAKKEIVEKFEELKTDSKPIMEIIEKICEGKIDRDLHLAAYILNPYYFYNLENREEILENLEYKTAILNCFERFFVDEELRKEVYEFEFLKYAKKEGEFFEFQGENFVKCSTFDSFDPVHWWSSYGCEKEGLGRMAKKIVSLTSSSFGCEKKWEIFKAIHIHKKRNINVKNMKRVRRISDDDFTSSDSDGEIEGYQMRKYNNNEWIPGFSF